MPVILPLDVHKPWLDPTLTEKEAACALLRPMEGRLMEAFPVSSHVNSPDNDDPRCIVPIDANE